MPPVAPVERLAPCPLGCWAWVSQPSTVFALHGDTIVSAQTLTPSDAVSPCSAPPAESPFQERDQHTPLAQRLPCLARSMRHRATPCGRLLRWGCRGALRAPYEPWGRRGYWRGRWGGRGRYQRKMPFIFSIRCP